MALTTAEFQRLLNNIGPAINEAFYGAYATIPDIIPFLFDRRGTQRTQEVYDGMGPLGLMGIFRDARNYDSPELLWQKTLSWKEFDIAISIQRKLLADIAAGGSERTLIDRAYNLGLSAARTKQQLAVNYYVNGTATSFAYDGDTFSTATPDGVALFSDSHPYSPNNASVQDNKTTNAFSYDNLKAARKTMMQFKDSRAFPIMVVPDTIACGPEIVDEVLAVTKSDRNPDNANNTVNTVTNGLFTGGLRIVETPYITDSDWFLLASNMLPTCAPWFDRETLELEDEYNFDQRKFAKAAHDRWGAGFIDWRFAIGNFPS